MTEARKDLAALGFILAAILAALFLITRPGTAAPPRAQPPPHLGAVGGVGGIGANGTWAMAEPGPLGSGPQVIVAQQDNSLNGMALDGVMGYRVTVQAPVGCTLNGTGTLQAWVYSPAVAAFFGGDGGWSRDPSLDLPMNVGLASCLNVDAGANNAFGGCSAATWPDLEPANAGGRVYYQANGIGLNASYDGGIACSGTGFCDAGCPPIVAIDTRTN